jgi:hypothetical protein
VIVEIVGAIALVMVGSVIVEHLLLRRPARAEREARAER